MAPEADEPTGLVPSDDDGVHLTVPPRIPTGVVDRKVVWARLGGRHTYVGMGEPLSRGVGSPDLLTASRTALALTNAFRVPMGRHDSEGGLP
jgi:hypothetical protein